MEKYLFLNWMSNNVSITNNPQFNKILIPIIVVTIIAIVLVVIKFLKSDK